MIKETIDSIKAFSDDKLLKNISSEDLTSILDKAGKDNVDNVVAHFSSLLQKPETRSYSWLYNNINIKDDEVAKINSFKVPGDQTIKIDADSSDDNFVAAFGFRTKIDRTLRRARMTDSILVLKTCLGVSKAKINRVLKICVALDYITTNNVLTAWSYHGDKWLNMLLHYNAFVNVEKFIYVSKKLSDQVKKYKSDMNVRLMFAECQSLAGYRNPPILGFDITAEARDLANSGARHGLISQTEGEWLDTFASVCYNICHETSVKQNRQFLTFKEYVYTDLWYTTGSSSIGHFTFEAEGDLIKIKARKNFVAVTVNRDALYELALQGIDKQVNTVLIKPELAKIRIAVAGDIGTYLVQSYINYLLNGVYKGFKYSTLEESLFTSHRRLRKTMNQLKNRYSLPFDFDKFDHQPQTNELKIMYKIVADMAKDNIPAGYIDTYNSMVAANIKSFDDAVLIVRDGRNKDIFKIKGGVNSGLRFTSLFGNLWNTVMSTIVSNLTSVLMGEVSEPDIYIRGDDSSIICNTYVQCLIFRLGYAAVNAKGNDSKFGIHYQETEFLRQWITQDKIYGYPNRSIPTINQSKPWNSTPYTPLNTLLDIIQAVATTSRRLSVEYVDRINCYIINWARKSKIDVRFFSLPKRYGGLGLSKWNGWMPTGKVRNFDLAKVFSTISFDIVNEEIAIYQQRYKEFNLSYDEAKDVVRLDTLQKLNNDDIIKLHPLIRDGFIDYLTNLRKVKWNKINIQNKMHRMNDSVHLQCYDLQSTHRDVELDTLYKTNQTKFNSYGHLFSRWQVISKVSKVKKTPLFKTFCNEHPTFRYDVLHLVHSKGMSRMEAIDYLFGKLSGIPNIYINPIISGVIITALLKAINMVGKLNRYLYAYLFGVVPYIYCQSFEMSDLYRSMYAN